MEVAVGNKRPRSPAPEHQNGRFEGSKRVDSTGADGSREHEFDLKDRDSHFLSEAGDVVSVEASFPASEEIEHGDDHKAFDQTASHHATQFHQLNRRPRLRSLPLNNVRVTEDENNRDFAGPLSASLRRRLGEQQIARSHLEQQQALSSDDQENGTAESGIAMRKSSGQLHEHGYDSDELQARFLSPSSPSSASGEDSEGGGASDVGSTGDEGQSVKTRAVVRAGGRLTSEDALAKDAPLPSVQDVAVQFTFLLAFASHVVWTDGTIEGFVSPITSLVSLQVHLFNMSASGYEGSFAGFLERQSSALITGCLALIVTSHVSGWQVFHAAWLLCGLSVVSGAGYYGGAIPIGCLLLLAVLHAGTRRLCERAIVLGWPLAVCRALGATRLVVALFSAPRQGWCWLSRAVLFPFKILYMLFSYVLAAIDNDDLGHGVFQRISNVSVEPIKQYSLQHPAWLGLSLSILFLDVILSSRLPKATETRKRHWWFGLIHAALRILVPLAALGGVACKDTHCSSMTVYRSNQGADFWISGLFASQMRGMLMCIALLLLRTPGNKIARKWSAPVLYFRTAGRSNRPYFVTGIVNALRDAGNDIQGPSPLLVKAAPRFFKSRRRRRGSLGSVSKRGRGHNSDPTNSMSKRNEAIVESGNSVLDNNTAMAKRAIQSLPNLGKWVAAAAAARSKGSGQDGLSPRLKHLPTAEKCEMLQDVLEAYILDSCLSKPIPPSISLEVRRERCMLDTLRFLLSFPSQVLLCPNFQVWFTGEPGIGEGVFRDWTTTVTKQLAQGSVQFSKTLQNPVDSAKTRSDVPPHAAASNHAALEGQQVGDSTAVMPLDASVFQGLRTTEGNNMPGTGGLSYRAMGIGVDVHSVGSQGRTGSAASAAIRRLGEMVNDSQPTAPVGSGNPLRWQAPMPAIPPGGTVDHGAVRWMSYPSSSQVFLFEELPGGNLFPCPSVAPQGVWRALGRFFGVCILHGIRLPLHMDTCVYKLLLEEPIVATDIQRVEPVYYRSRIRALLQKGGVQVMEAALGEPLYFEEGGVELVHGGLGMRVTESNKKEFVRLLCLHKITRGAEEELGALQYGMFEMIPRTVMQSIGLTSKELGSLIQGIAEVDLCELRSRAQSNIPQFLENWFWNILDGFSPDELEKLLVFATGSSSLPQEDVLPGPVLVLDVLEQSVALPTAHTCARLLCLPLTKSKDDLENKLRFAVMNTEGFGQI